jgi:hypothetical protein
VSSQCSIKQTRKDFIDGRIGVDGVVNNYLDWLDWIFYVILVRFNYSKGIYERVIFRGVKRGDDKYSFLTCRKFDRLKRFGEGLEFFKRGSHGYVKGSGLLVTLEYNSNLIGISDAWLSVGKDTNRCFSRLRKIYGRFSVVRVWESHESGYPHVHALIIFHDYTFNGRRMYNAKKNRWLYRVYGSDFNQLKSSWVHGFSDFEMGDSFRGGIKYLSKYLTKSTSASVAFSDKKSKKGIVGLAMCCVFHKRSFSISGNLFTDEISILCNSNLNSYKENSEECMIKVGVDLYGNSIYEKVTCWRLFGFCVRNGVKWDDWRMHAVAGRELELVDDTLEVSSRSHYKLNDSGIYA